MTRQNISRKIIGKKLVNRYFPSRRVLLGDKYLVISLQTKVRKDNYVTAFEPKFPKKRFDKKKQKGQLSFNSATVVKKPITQAPVEQIKRVILTGLSDDDLFGPAFLYEETEFFTEKKVIPANPVQMEHKYPMEEEDEDEDDYEYIVQCFHCGQGVHPDEEPYG